MKKNPVPVLVIAGAALVGLLVGTAFPVSHAQAGSVECESFNLAKHPSKTLGPWMTAQSAAGRTQFVVMGNQVCAM